MSADDTKYNLYRNTQPLKVLRALAGSGPGGVAWMAWVACAAGQGCASRAEWPGWPVQLGGAAQAGGSGLHYWARPRKQRGVA
jgi:hypothetical protein